MLISKNWLQTYFKEPLPNTEKIADAFTMGIFEIDGIEEKETDTVFDIKTLADRNPYALSHRYMAHELGVLLKQPAQFSMYEEIPGEDISRKLTVTITDPAFCYRYIGRVIEGVTVGPSPTWLKEKLEVLGQRSINSTVDLTNFVMLDTGQPLHAFDADKVKGTIQVRRANQGEEIVLLDGTSVKLKPEYFVIADDEGALAIAGVKGGKKAEVTSSTKNIILEAATFNGPSVRKTAQAVNIRNDSTKRFENQITPERAWLALTEVSALIAKENSLATYGSLVDQYPSPQVERAISVKAEDINGRLGIEIPTSEMTDILTRLNLGVKEDNGTLTLTIPLYRSDLVITEDIAEEVGRVYGYEHIKGVLPPAVSRRKINKNFYYHNLIRKTLVDLGYSEVYTYTLQDKGEVALLNPLNAHRGYMRDDLSRAIGEKLEHNLRYADLLGLSEIKLFEIGKIFGGKNERYSFAFGLSLVKTPKGYDTEKELKAIASSLGEVLGASLTEHMKVTGSVVEIELDEVITLLPEPTEDIFFESLVPVTYKPFSTYPFAVRDIAVFVPGEKGKDLEVCAIIIEESGALLVHATLFDVFTKTDKESGEVKTSYAYRLVFQAKDRTLNEDDLNDIMKRITDKMNAKEGWLVR